MSAARAWVCVADAALAAGPTAGIVETRLGVAAGGRDGRPDDVRVALLVDALGAWRRAAAAPERIEEAGRWRAVVVALRDLAVLAVPTRRGGDGAARPDLEGTR